MQVVLSLPSDCGVPRDGNDDFFVIWDERGECWGYVERVHARAELVSGFLCLSPSEMRIPRGVVGRTVSIIPWRRVWSPCLVRAKRTPVW